MPTALVTGATGLVGAYLVEQLAAQGWTVRAMVRDPQRARWLEGLGASDFATVDILDADACARASVGCATIFHTAAALTPVGGWEVYRRPNVDGTRHVVAAAERSGARLLHLSSVAVYGSTRFGADGVPTDEQTPFGPLDEHAYYHRSKRDAEEIVMAAHRAGRIWATAVRPCVIYGERDRQFTPRAARLFSLGVAPAIGGGARRFAVVHAANVAQAAIRAAAHDAAGGQAYVTANDFDISFADFARLAGQGLGRRVRVVRVPGALSDVALRMFGMVMRTARSGAGGQAAALGARGIADFLTRDNPFSSERARRELGWTPTVRPETGVPAAFQWWRTQHDASR